MNNMNSRDLFRDVNETPIRVTCSQEGLGPNLTFNNELCCDGKSGATTALPSQLSVKRPTERQVHHIFNCNFVLYHVTLSFISFLLLRVF